MKKINFVLTILFCIMCVIDQDFSTASQDNSISKIIFVVNGQPVKSSYFQERIELFKMFSGRKECDEKSKENIKKKIIDEKLQMQEILRIKKMIPNKKHLEATNTEIKLEIARIASMLGIDIKTLFKMLEERKISPTTLIQQIEVGILWNKMIMMAFAYNIQPSDEDVIAEMEKINKNDNKTYLLDRITISISSKEDENKSKEIEDKIIDSLNKGASFPLLATQYSTSAESANGGVMGWVSEGRLNKELCNKLNSAKYGEIIGPIKTPSSHTIYRIRGKRDINTEIDQYTVQILWIPVDVTLIEKNQLDQLLQILANSKLEAGDDLQYLEKCIAKYGIPAKVNKSDFLIDELEPHMYFGIKDLNINEMSEVILGSFGVVIVKIIEKKKIKMTKPTSEQIKNSLTYKKLDKISDKRLSELRRDSYIEVKN